MKAVPADPPKPKPFQQPQTGPSPFASAGPLSTPQGPNPFLQQAGAATGAAQPSQYEKNPYPPDSSKQHPPLSSYASRGPDGRLTAWMGQPVAYRWRVGDKYEDKPPPGATAADKPVPFVRSRDGTWRKIFFPDGPPAYNGTTEPENPTTDYTEAIKAVYARMAAAGRFEGDMPEVPPMREDCAWAF